MTPYAVILAGGKGKRFWPYSRSGKPKQFLPIVGDRPMIRQTVDRIRSLIPSRNILVVTGSDLLGQVRESVPEIPEDNILLEPVGRNTAPCIAWASRIIASRNPDASIAVLASDHFIPDAEAFCALMGAALRFSASGRYLLTLGIRPTRPETGYGYLRIGSSIPCEESAAVHHVDRFVEKPDQTRALEYLASGRYLWNSGMFVFSAQAINQAFETLCPEIHAIVSEIVLSGNNPSVIDRLFPTLPDISIDYAIMERSDRIAAFPVDFQWADVGSWDALIPFVDESESGNRIQGGHVLIQCRNTFVTGHDRTVVGIGIEDLIIVDTKDALLVCRRDLAQKVNEVVGILSKNPDTEHLV